MRFSIIELNEIRDLKKLEEQSGGYKRTCTDRNDQGEHCFAANVSLHLTQTNWSGQWNVNW